jgi:hypothetical protein
MCRHFYPTRATVPDHLIPLHLTAITFRLYKLRNSCSCYRLQLPLTFPTFINALPSAPDQVPPQAKHAAKTHFCKKRVIYATLCQYSTIHTSLFKIVTFHRFYPLHTAGTRLSGHRPSANPNQTSKLCLTISRSSHSVCLPLSFCFITLQFPHFY